MRSIDGGPFQAYRRILGEHELGDFRLQVLTVPPDALGGPARLRLSIDRARAGLDGGWSRGELARLVLEDAIVRAAERALLDLTGAVPASAPGSGRLSIDPPGPDIVERTSTRVGDEAIEVALSFELPAVGRRVRGQQAEAILFEHLPRLGMAALLFPVRRVRELKARIAELARRREIEAGLPARGLSLVVPTPALHGRHVAPGTLTSIATAHGPVEGLAVPVGITVFVAAGVAGAGAWLRQLVDPRAGGAAILGGPVALLRPARHRLGPLDVRAFIRACPDLPHPDAYVGEDAPAPVAVAASLVEAIEAGARLVVVDEDELPAGAMGGDGPMQHLVDSAPALAPLTERLASVRDGWGVSFLVAARAGSGLLDVADTLFIVRGDRLDDATEAFRTAKRAAGRGRAPRVPDAVMRPAARSMRIVTAGAPTALKVAAWGGRGVRVGDDLIDLEDTPLVRDPARLRAVAALLKHAARGSTAWRPIDEVLNELEAASSRPALDRLEEPGLVDLARPSRIDIANALSRWKRVEFRVATGTLRSNAEELP